MSSLVPNPMYQALSDLYAQLQNDAAAMAGPMKWSDQAMTGGSGGCWTGAAARAWASQLAGYSADCAAQVSNMLDEVASTMAAAQQQVTQQQAQSIAKLMAMSER
jgi:hypothetical protein